MQTILLLNGGKAFGESGGKLNEALHNVAKETLESLELKVLETHIDKGYEVEAELQKLLDSDVWIWQFPGWWMGEPWIVKKYIDEVLYAGHTKLYTNDGRSRQDPSKKYGSGGLAQGKKYLFSTTWNAPLEAFTESGQFFESQGIDGLLFHLHKAHEFIGLKALPSFMCNDVHKDPNFEKYKADYKTHLQKVFAL